MLLTSLRETLVHDGHQVETANGGQAGIEAFLDALNAGKPFPVVITDLGMPHVDGRAVAAAIKAAAPATFDHHADRLGPAPGGLGRNPDGSGRRPRASHRKLAELRQCLAD